MTRLIGILLALIMDGMAGSVALAGCVPEEPSCSKAIELTTALRYEATIHDLTLTCLNAIERVQPAVLVEQDPDAFAGLNPASAAWPLIMSAWKTLAREACGDETLERSMLDEYRKAWRTRLSLKQLEAALALLKSPAGRSLTQALYDVHRTVARRYDQVIEDRRQRALIEFHNRLEEIKANAARPK